MENAQETVVEPSETVTHSDSAETPKIATKEQIDALRNHLYNNFLGEYKRFLNIIISSPVAIEGLDNALRFLDTGMLWVKEAAYHGPLVNKQATPSPIEESKEEVEKEELKEVSAA